MKRVRSSSGWLFLFLSAAAAAAAIWFAADHFFFREERAIRSLIADLCSAVSLKAAAKGPAVLPDVSGIDRIFTEEIEVISDSPRINRKFTIPELKRLLLMYKKNHSAVTLVIEENSLEIRQDSARCSGIAILDVSGSKGPSREVRESVIFCNRNGGRWRITKIELRQLVNR